MIEQKLSQMVSWGLPATGNFRPLVVAIEFSWSEVREGPSQELDPPLWPHDFGSILNTPVILKGLSPYQPPTLKSFRRLKVSTFKSFDT